MNFFAKMSLFFVHFLTESYAGQSGSPIFRLLDSQRVLTSLRTVNALGLLGQLVVEERVEHVYFVRPDFALGLEFGQHMSTKSAWCTAEQPRKSTRFTASQIPTMCR